MSEVQSGEEMYLRMAEYGHALKVQLQDLCLLELLVPQTGTREVTELVVGLDAEGMVGEVMVREVIVSAVVRSGLQAIHCAFAYESGCRHLTCLAKAMNEI